MLNSVSGVVPRKVRTIRISGILVRNAHAETVEKSRSPMLKARYAKVGEASPELSASSAILRRGPLT
jgi:hypothetical protein